jgi:hypothetical protein
MVLKLEVIHCVEDVEVLGCWCLLVNLGVEDVEVLGICFILVHM